jgi:glycine betaine/proline transport system substrate-binding protein
MTTKNVGKLVALATATSTILAIGNPVAAKTPVVIGELPWSGATAIEHVLSQVMTERLDADVSTISAAIDALFAAMDKGDGSVDVVADMWVDHLPAQMKAYVLPGSRETIILNREPYYGSEGTFVPAYVREQHGIKDLADLAKPEVAKLFDSDGNGKGELWAGAVGWESVSLTEIRGKSYGFDKTMEYTTVDQAVFLAQLKDAYERKKPIVFYYWTPEWIFAAFDLVKLQEPEFTGYTMDSAKGSERYNPQGCYTYYQPSERADWLEASRITCGQPPARVHVAHSKALAERAPKIARFLEQVRIDPKDVDAWIYAMEVEKVPVDQVAGRWIADHRQEIEGVWLAGLR